MGIFTIKDTGQQRILVILAFVTLGIVGAFSFYVARKSVDKKYRNHSEALRVAEYGLQQVLQEINTTHNVSGKIIEKSVNNGKYRIEIFQKDSSLLKITATGKSGDSKRQIICLVKKNSSNQEPKFTVEKWEEK